MAATKALLREVEFSTEATPDNNISPASASRVIRKEFLLKLGTDFSKRCSLGKNRIPRSVGFGSVFWGNRREKLSAAESKGASGQDEFPPIDLAAEREGSAAVTTKRRYWTRFLGLPAFKF